MAFFLSARVIEERGLKAMKGTVKWFNNKRGYGFITSEEGSDLFVHYSQIQGEGFRTLRDGEPVEFEITQGPKGEQAVNVTRPAAASA